MVKIVRNLSVLSVGLTISAIVGWLLLRETRRGREASRLPVRAGSAEPLPHIPLPLEPLEPEVTPGPVSVPLGDTDQPDDLTRIRDIGPRFAQALHAVGITRFAQLAAQTPETLAEQLAAHVSVRAERIRNNDWIGQAARLIND